jgi:CRISPR-associated exonuclease Cas4
MNITGTHINYYFICKRKLWLFANGIQMEHTSDNVQEGKLIHETTYEKRPDKYKEISVEGIKVDYFDVKNKIVHEIKKSSKSENAHIWQVKYYIYVLNRNNIACVGGKLEYPKLKETKEVVLKDEDMDKLKEIEIEIGRIIKYKNAPEKVEMKICKKCSYYDFCWV